MTAAGNDETASIAQVASATPDVEVDRDAATLGYSEAIAELNAILADLEDDRLDVDRLAEKVERAAELIAACRDRIGIARLRVQQIVAELDEHEVADEVADDSAEGHA